MPLPQVALLPLRPQRHADAVESEVLDHQPDVRQDVGDLVLEPLAIELPGYRLALVDALNDAARDSAAALIEFFRELAEMLQIDGPRDRMPGPGVPQFVGVAHLA